MKQMITAVWLVFLLASGCWDKQGSLNRRVFDLNREKTLMISEMIERILSFWIRNDAS